MTRSYTFLVNPASGGGAAPAAVVPVARALRDAGATVDVTYSPGPLAMGTLVASAVERGDVVVSVGGDGMLSSLAGLVSALSQIFVDVSTSQVLVLLFVVLFLQFRPQGVIAVRSRALDG